MPHNHITGLQIILVVLDDGENFSGITCDERFAAGMVNDDLSDLRGVGAVSLSNFVSDFELDGDGRFISGGSQTHIIRPRFIISLQAHFNRNGG